MNKQAKTWQREAAEAICSNQVLHVDDIEKVIVEAERKVLIDAVESHPAYDVVKPYAIGMKAGPIPWLPLADTTPRDIRKLCQQVKSGDRLVAISNFIIPPDSIAWILDGEINEGKIVRAGTNRVPSVPPGGRIARP